MERDRQPGCPRQKYSEFAAAERGLSETPENAGINWYPNLKCGVLASVAVRTANGRRRSFSRSINPIAQYYWHSSDLYYSGPQIMVETRIAPRCRVNKPAAIHYGGDKYPCTVRDISTTGAALEFADPVNRLLPNAKTFTLVMPDDGLRLPCHVVWQRDYRMGVAFD
jgi:hypothetical protein